jgi:hypothetical protein
VECGNGTWLLVLMDHEGQQKCTFQAESWASILPTLERILGSGCIPWVNARSYREKKKPPEDAKR